ncbi:hypothetical protein LX32DRAFT_48043 [Colletotrichum zoysiae]|uniref:Uncharacterized protein n=1 Tax=Colletotrichum zoysiae TaxID=1216348 RepID=A0AAD9HB02_9PEZI|nr:hypothetical protein LX32DRAFT_48043 [Colletotrichum zoysiae]
MRPTSPLLVRLRTVYLLAVPTIFTHLHHHLEPRRLSQDASQGSIPPNSLPDLVGLGDEQVAMWITVLHLVYLPTNICLSIHSESFHSGVK